MMMMTNEFYVSPERYEELRKELNTLKTEGRMEIAEDLKRAKEFGDLSENSEYAEARQKQNAIETRIFELEELLKRAKIIQKTNGSDVVHVGSTLTVKKNGDTLDYTIVGSDESDPQKNLISNESPLGRAFLGRKVGDTIEVSTPSGKITYRITKIA